MSVISFAGTIAEIRGKVDRGLHGAANRVVIAGKIGRDAVLILSRNAVPEKSGINLTGGRNESGLTITESAVIGGSVAYRSGSEADVRSGAQITGGITRQTPESEPRENRLRILWGWGGLYSVFAALVVGLVLISLWPERTKALADNMVKNIGTSIGWGAIVMFMTPIISVILAITLIGIPLALILLGIWLILMYVSKIFVGIIAGRFIFERIRSGRDESPKKEERPVWLMITGVIVSWTIFSVPVIGWLLSLVAIWWGLGGLWLSFGKNR